MTNLEITKINPLPAVTPSKSYASGGDVKNFVKAMRSQVQNFSDRDFIAEFNAVAEKNTPCNAGSSKQPTLKFLNAVEKEFKEVNAHIGGAARIGNQYAKLLHNQRHLDTAYRKIHEQTFINTLRDAGNPILTDTPHSESVLKVPSVALDFKHESSIPNGTIKKSDPEIVQSQPKQQPQQFPKHEVSYQPTANYSLSPAPDIFSSPKVGGHVSYKIVPFDLMAGS